MKVEVELEDLETIVFVTAIIKTIETALQSRKEDPFVQPHLTYTNAHNNLVTAINHARRSQAGTAVAWDGELTNSELTFLKYKMPDRLDGEQRIRSQEIDSLAAKGVIRIGQCVRGVVWPGASKAELKPIENFAIELTPRGKQKLDEALQKEIQQKLNDKALEQSTNQKP